MATIATVANGFGTEGWMLTDLVSAHHNTYLLSFEAVSGDAESDHATGQTLRKPVSTNLG
jgi:hypothetical protein